MLDITWEEDTIGDAALVVPAGWAVTPDPQGSSLWWHHPSGRAAFMIRTARVRGSREDREAAHTQLCALHASRLTELHPGMAFGANVELQDTPPAEAITQQHGSCPDNNGHLVFVALTARYPLGELITLHGQVAADSVEQALDDAQQLAMRALAGVRGFHAEAPWFDLSQAVEHRSGPANMLVPPGWQVTPATADEAWSAHNLSIHTGLQVTFFQGPAQGGVPQRAQALDTLMDSYRIALRDLLGSIVIIDDAIIDGDELVIVTATCRGTSTAPDESNATTTVTYLLHLSIDPAGTVVVLKFIHDGDTLSSTDLARSATSFRKAMVIGIDRTQSE